MLSGSSHLSCRIPHPLTWNAPLQARAHISNRSVGEVKRIAVLSQPIEDRGGFFVKGIENKAIFERVDSVYIQDIITRVKWALYLWRGHFQMLCLTSLTSKDTFSQSAAFVYPDMKHFLSRHTSRLSKNNLLFSHFLSFCRGYGIRRNTALVEHLHSFCLRSADGCGIYRLVWRRRLYRTATPC